MTCGGAGFNQCSKCASNTYLDSETSTCIDCSTGEYSEAGSSSCSECYDDNCDSCSDGGEGKCTSCSEGFLLNAETGKCETCTDDGCSECSALGLNKCTSCQANYYLDTTSNTCTTCGEGKVSAAGSTRAADCSGCADLNCNTCLAGGLKQCSTCAANTYLDSYKTCPTCPDGTYSVAGAESSADCKTCQDSNCALCSGEGTGKCTQCLTTFGLTTDGTCATCTATNCDTCDSANLAKCLTCSIGYKLSAGACELISGDVTVQVSATLRYQMTMEDYENAGGDEHITNDLAASLNKNPGDISIDSVTVGSVIIKFSIKSTGTGTLAEQQQQLKDIKAALDDAVKSGTLNAYPTATILNYESGVVVITPVESCPSGQSPDSNGICVDNDDGGANLGAILGGVLGGLALIMVIALIAYKKGAFANLTSAKSPSSAKYDLAKSQPTSPDSKTTPTEQNA